MGSIGYDFFHHEDHEDHEEDNSLKNEADNFTSDDLYQWVIMLN